jgi:glycosyltransferase involved in cell wall biosynthesis
VAREATAAGLRVELLRERPLDVAPTIGDRARAAGRLLGHAAEVRRLVRRVRPDVVTAWGIPTLVAADGALRTVPRPPRLVFQHNDYVHRTPIGRLVRSAATRCARIVVLSGPIAEDLDPAGALAGRIVTVHPGVDLGRFEASRPPAEAHVLLLGAIVGWKRPDLALEIVARTPGARLTLAGEPLDDPGRALLAELQARAHQPDLAGRVTFAGRLPDPRGALRAARVLLHCSDAEPFGLVMAEALASGRPVCAPAAGGPLEIVDPTSGRLYPPGDARAGAAALTEVLVLADELSAPARARAERCFDVRQSRLRFAAVLDEVAAGA